MIDRRAERAADPRITFALLAAMVTSVTVLQRIAIPPFGLSFAIVVVLAGVGFLLLSGALVEDRLRAGLYLLSAALCLLAAASTFVLGRESSLSSVLLLVVLYAPFAYVLRPELVTLYPRVLEYFCRVMVLGSILSIGQWAAQVLGWPYSDPFDALPQSLVVDGYNTTYPLEYGSSIMKSNGFVFLEPSFCSQFLALAAIVQLVRGEKRWRVPLYVVAIIPTVSGTGPLLLVFGLFVLSLRRSPLWSFGLLAVAGITTAAIALSPAGELFAARAAEVPTSESSVSLRLVEPFQLAYENLGSDETAPLVGLGPGFVERETDDHFQRTDRHHPYPVPTKLMAEYGLVAGAAFILFTLVAFWSGAPSPTIAACVLFMHLALSASLLQPQTVYLGFLLTALFAAPQRVPAARPLFWRRLSAA